MFFFFYFVCSLRLAWAVAFDIQISVVGVVLMGCGREHLWSFWRGVFGGEFLAGSFALWVSLGWRWGRS